jgi:hypothetical protein
MHADADAELQMHAIEGQHSDRARDSIVVVLSLVWLPIHRSRLMAIALVVNSADLRLSL